MAAHTQSDICGIATFIKNSAKWKPIVASPPDIHVEWAATLVEGVSIINIYKPSMARLKADTILPFDPPCIYAGDFNCHSTTWGYTSSNPDGLALEDWASVSSVQLLYDPKQADSFHSGR